MKSLISECNGIQSDVNTGDQNFIIIAQYIKFNC